MDWPLIMQSGARIRSLQEPAKKMSKSDENQNAFISLKDDKDAIIRKFKRAVTDSEARVCMGEGKDGVNNLIEIYAAVAGKTPDDIAREFEGRGYGDFKLAVGEAVAQALAPIQQRFDTLMKDKAQLESLMRVGAERASAVAERTLKKAMKKMGFVQL